MISDVVLGDNEVTISGSVNMPDGVNGLVLNGPITTGQDGLVVDGNVSIGGNAYISDNAYIREGLLVTGTLISGEINTGPIRAGKIQISDFLEVGSEFTLTPIKGGAKITGLLDLGDLSNSKISTPALNIGDKFILTANDHGAEISGLLDIGDLSLEGYDDGMKITGRNGDLVDFSSKSYIMYVDNIQANKTLQVQGEAKFYKQITIGEHASFIAQPDGVAFTGSLILQQPNTLRVDTIQVNETLDMGKLNLASDEDGMKITGKVGDIVHFSPRRVTSFSGNVSVEDTLQVNQTLQVQGEAKFYKQIMLGEHFGFIAQPNGATFVGSLVIQTDAGGLTDNTAGPALHVKGEFVVDHSLTLGKTAIVDDDSGFRIGRPINVFDPNQKGAPHATLAPDHLSVASIAVDSLTLGKTPIVNDDSGLRIERPINVFDPIQKGASHATLAPDHLSVQNGAFAGNVIVGGNTELRGLVLVPIPGGKPGFGSPQPPTVDLVHTVFELQKTVALLQQQVAALTQRLDALSPVVRH